ncbi:phage tail sheath subtilisin-like domain-containing protein [Novacetimonas sp. GS1]|uniref:phage tail sheath subtilisin-like domain-containing protein n=1 Tax=Novacetimonas sp. GS1 TaxID=3119990 RepID=UPI002FCCEAEB
MSGLITFNSYPTSQRTHGVFAEIDPQNQGGSQNLRTLILGQKLSSGNAVANTPFLATGISDARVSLGAGSIAELIYTRYLDADSFGEVWIAPQDDDPAAVVATGSLTVSGTLTASGTIPLYIGGTYVAVGVTLGMALTDIAAAIVAAVNATQDIMVTAAPGAANTDGSVPVTFTALNKGPCGNEIDLRAAYLGSAGGENIPAGLTLTFTAMSGGTQNPDTGLSATLLNLGEQTFDFIIMPYTDTASLDLLDQFLDDTTGRWAWSQMLYGGYFCALRGTVGALGTAGAARNAYQGTPMGFDDSPDPAWLWAAGYAGACAVSLRADPGLPLQDLVIPVKAPPLASRFDISERNTLLYDGISTFTVNATGQVVIDRAITFYQKDAAGGADTTWLNVETPYSLVALIRDMQAWLQAIYARKKLVADGTNIPGGSNLVTSQTVLASAIARYKQYCDDGNAQNYAAFKAAASAQNLGNGTVALLLPFNLVGQLRVIAMKVNFIPG